MRRPAPVRTRIDTGGCLGGANLSPGRLGRVTLLCAALAAAGLFGAVGCSESNLYHRYRPPAEADRLALSGEVCSEDPATARFPVKLVLVVDRAAGPLSALYDPGGTRRLEVLRPFVQSALTNPEYELAVVGYAARSRKLAPTVGNFTRNPGELDAAITQSVLSESCSGVEQCRDYQEGIRTARALIEGDMAELTAGERILTQYVVILVNAGEHRPLAQVEDCCDPDTGSCAASTRAGCQQLQDSQLVADFADAVEQGGAAGLRFHTIHLAADTDEDINDRVQATLEQAAFAGAGLYQRYALASAFNLVGLDVLDLRTVLRVKGLVVSNRNAVPSAEGLQADSDGDGLSDDEEVQYGTDPLLRDSDDDGIGDLVEVLVGFDPLSPDSPPQCAQMNAAADLDRDGLTNCEEVLVGTEPSLVDTDGDGMPDRLELISGTDYLHPDTLDDLDGDGVPNGEELLAHTDPRSADAADRLSGGYRYEVENLGIQRRPAPPRLELISGVEVVGVSDGSTAGIGTLRYFGGDAPSLTWQDAGDGTAGPAVAIGAGGLIELPSSSYAPVQGDSGRFLRVSVDPELLAPNDVLEQVRILFTERECIRYTVRNVRLVPIRSADETDEDGDGDESTETVEGGWNELFLYFGQAPEGASEIPGPFRLAHVPVYYAPPDHREPPGAILQVRDEEFVRPRLDQGLGQTRGPATPLDSEGNTR